MQYKTPTLFSSSFSSSSKRKITTRLREGVNPKLRSLRIREFCSSAQPLRGHKGLVILIVLFRTVLAPLHISRNPCYPQLAWQLLMSAASSAKVISSPSLPSFQARHGLPGVGPEAVPPVEPLRHERQPPHAWEGSRTRRRAIWKY